MTSIPPQSHRMCWTGYPAGTAEPIAALLAKLQPNAMAFQGPGNNVIRWVGTEDGHAPYPTWSTAQSSWDAGAGDPNAPVWVPAESDTCLQTDCAAARSRNMTGGESGKDAAPYSGCWFYNPDMCPKSRTELISTYHDTVGHNSYLLLDWTPTPAGDLRPDHIAAYQVCLPWCLSHRAYKRR